jgi:hypothetical protein
MQQPKIKVAYTASSPKYRGRKLVNDGRRATAKGTGRTTVKDRYGGRATCSPRYVKAAHFTAKHGGRTQQPQLGIYKGRSNNSKLHIDDRHRLPLYIGPSYIMQTRYSFGLHATSNMKKLGLHKVTMHRRSYIGAWLARKKKLAIIVLYVIKSTTQIHTPQPVLDSQYRN